MVLRCADGKAKKASGSIGCIFGGTWNGDGRVSCFVTVSVGRLSIMLCEIKG
jgi:hypothetical protein